MQENPAQNGNGADLLKEMVKLSIDLQRINSYLNNGQCVQAYRHAVAMKTAFGTRSEPKQVLESMIRFIYEGRQVQADAELKRLGDIIRVAYEDILKKMKGATANEAATTPDVAKQDS